MQLPFRRISHLLALMLGTGSCPILAQTAVTIVGPGPTAATFNGIPIANAFRNPLWLATTPAGALLITSNEEPRRIDGMLLQLQPAGGLIARSNVPAANEIATDGLGNVYSVSRLQGCVRRNLVAFAGTCHTGFGDPPNVSTGDGGPALRAGLAEPGAIAADGKGNVFIWENFTGNLRRVGPDGVISTVLRMPGLFTVPHMAVGLDGELYLSGYDGSVVGSASLYRLAGGQLARIAPFPADAQSNDFAIDADGNFYTSDCSLCENPTIVRISRSGQRSRILAGTTFRGEITALAFDRAGSLFIATAPRNRSGQNFGSTAEARIWRAAGVGRALPACTYTITPTNPSLPATGGTLTIAVETDASCAWVPTAGTESADLSIVPFGAPFLSGPAQLTVTVARNSGPERNLQLIIGGRTFLIRQAAGGTETGPPQPPGPVPPPAQPGCTFTLEPKLLALQPPGTDAGVIRVTTQPNCRWDITLSMPWIQLSGTATRQGNGVVNFSIPPNSGPDPRGGVITIGNVSFAVIQATTTAANRPLPRDIVNGASFTPVISPNSFATIVGTALNAGTANWDNAVRDGVFPKELLFTRVRVNGLDTYPVYVSPTQINFLTPPNSFLGTVPVEISYAGRSPWVRSAEYKPAAPGFFSITASNGRRYPVAYISNTSTLVAPAGAFPGADSRPARPGDSITLYATGLGPTATPPPLGRALTAPLAVADLDAYRVRLGGVTIERLDYVGMIYAGLYQINLTIPPGIPTGELDFALTYGAGVTTAADGLKLTTEEAAAQ